MALNDSRGLQHLGYLTNLIIILEQPEVRIDL